MSSHYPAALFLPGDSFDTESRQLFGRRVAGRQFAQALAANLRADELLTAITLNEGDARTLQQALVHHLAPGGRLRVQRGLSMQGAREAGSLHVPAPDLSRWCQLRPWNEPRAFSITGVIHTLCTSQVLNSLEDLALAPLYPWDALVCTSRAGRQVVERCLEERMELLRRRFHQPDLARPPGPLLPVIPLTVDGRQAYTPELSRSERRARARHALGISAENFVVAFVGRLSFHSKAHPQPLYRVLAKIARNTTGITLIECGHFFNEGITAAYDDLQHSFDGLSFLRVGGSKPASEGQKWEALAAADVFTSPADNLQETFGLTLIEAMAAELPVVVSDWDGYRDLVKPDVSGFLVPTHDVLPTQGSADKLEVLYRLGLVDYDMMIGIRAMGVVVDEEALERCFTILLHDADKRQSMAEAGLRHFEERFSGRIVAEQYRELWEELAETRASENYSTKHHQLHASYGKVFSQHASTIFEASRVERIEGSTPPEWLKGAMAGNFLQFLLGGQLYHFISLLESRNSLGLADLHALGINGPEARMVLAALVKFGVASPARD